MNKFYPTKQNTEFFSPEKIMNSGEIFRMYKDSEEKIFRVFSRDKLLKIKEGDEGSFLFSCSEDEFKGYWSRFFDLDTDYRSLYDTCCHSGGYLEECAKASNGIRVLNQDLFEMMISFIISQQKRIPEIRKCIEALCARFGEKKKMNGEEYYAFPTPEALVQGGPDGLKGLSLGYRERYVYESALQYSADGYIKSEAFRSLPFEAARDHLKKYCGIGEKVANCICLFALGYKDAFPVDVHIKDILHREFGVGGDDYRRLSDITYRTEAERIFKAFAGSKGIIQQWMFARELSYTDG